MKKGIAFVLALIMCVALCACGKSEEVQNAESLIANIGEVSLDSEEAIINAENAVLSLTEKDLKHIEGLEKLNNARETYDMLADEKRVSDVEACISKIGSVTLESEKDIAAAKEAYNALDASLQERVVTFDEIEKAESELFALRVKDIENTINAIGAVSLESEKSILDAEKKYNEYSSEVQNAVSNISLLESSKKEYSLLKVDQAKELISAIGSVTLESETAIDAAKKAYAALTDDEKGQIDNYATLTAAEASYKDIKEEAERQAAIEAARSYIRVTKVAVSMPDSAGGVELYFNYVNNSDKVIKYVTFGVTFYNSVGDVAKCKYKNDVINYCKDTGPFEKGTGRSGTWWHWGDFYNWEIKTVELVYLSVEYTDGTTKNFTSDELSYVQY